MGDDASTGRRQALRVLATTGAGVGCAALALTSARFVVAPAGAGGAGGRWIPTIPFDSLREGEPRRVELVADHRDAWTLEKSVQLGVAWLLREGDQVKAWSGTCPHLGCAIDRPATGPGFYCPCHDSSFDPQGKRLTGPSPRDLDALATRIEAGTVVVEFHRFRQGTAEKSAVG